MATLSSLYLYFISYQFISILYLLNTVFFTVTMLVIKIDNLGKIYKRNVYQSKGELAVFSYFLVFL